MINMKKTLLMILASLPLVPLIIAEPLSIPEIREVSPVAYEMQIASLKEATIPMLEHIKYNTEQVDGVKLSPQDIAVSVFGEELVDVEGHSPLGMLVQDTLIRINAAGDDWFYDDALLSQWVRLWEESRRLKARREQMKRRR